MICLKTFRPVTFNYDYFHQQYIVEHSNEIYLTNLNVFGATYRPRQDLYANNYSVTAFVKQKHKVRGAFNKFPDFFGMDTFINRTHKKL